MKKEIHFRVRNQKYGYPTWFHLMSLSGTVEVYKKTFSCFTLFSFLFQDVAELDNYVPTEKR